MTDAKTILIVDDEDEIRENLCDYLEFSGYNIQEACDGAEALNVLATQKPHLMLSDLMMPNIGGLQLLHALKEKHIDNVPVVIMTAFGTMEYAIEAMKNGAADFISKPIDLEYLKTVIDRVLQRSEMEKKIREHQRQLELDLQHAARIQQCQLPDPIDTPLYSLHYRFQPLIAIGGDYFTIHQENEHRLTVALYDVAGHGVSAALTASMAHNQLRMLMHAHPSPSEILKHLNKIVTEQVGTTSMFLTGILASIDSRERKLSVCNAGHPEGYLIKRVDHTIHPLVSKTTPVGFMDNLMGDSKECTYDLQSGDRLVLYTDGFLESRISEGDMVGQDSLRKMIHNHCDLPPQQFIDTLFDELERYRVGEQEDDLTLVVVDMK